MNNCMNLTGDNRVRVPNGLSELISDIAKEVLRNQPISIIPFIAQYIEARLKARESGETGIHYVDTILEEVGKDILDYKKYGLTRDTAEQAARKIQGLYRGHKTRKQIKSGTLSRQMGSTAKKQHIPSKHSIDDTHMITDLKTSSYRSITGDSIMYEIPSIQGLSDHIHLFGSPRSSTSSLFHPIAKAEVNTALGTIKSGSISENSAERIIHKSQ